MRSVILAFLIGLAAPLAFPQESQDAPDKSAATVAAPAEAKSEVVPEFKPPAGFHVRKRGDVTVYCRKDSDIGTRFAAERCYSREQLAELEAATEANKREFDQHRRVCSNPAVCAGG